MTSIIEVTAATLCMIMSCICGCVAASCWVRVDEYMQMDNLSEVELAMPNRQLSITYSKNIDPDINCSICLEKIELDENICTLYCDHTYHDECFQKWAIVKIPISCPICRRCI